MENFRNLGLSEDVLRSISEMGFENPTEIQSKAIPKLLTLDPDLIGLAQTGTGKTAAFGLPLIEKIEIDNPNTQAVILGPTRELVQQIGKELNQFSKYKKGLKIKTIYGGTPVGKQEKELKKYRPQILIATPGRMIDMINRRAVRIENLRFLVLDEADEMLKMGFQEEIDTILKFAPETRMTWLFSATMPREIRRIVNSYMVDPIEVKVDPSQSTNKNIEHQYILVKKSDKLEALKRIMDVSVDLYCVIFCRTKRDTQELSDILNKEGYKAEALHGDMAQKQRDSAMYRFRRRDNLVLCATDVAARGLDVDDLTHVIHYALPDSIDYYTHRSGRTARAGKKGISLSLISPSETKKFKHIETSLNIQAVKVDIPRYSALLEQKIQNWINKIKAIEIDPQSENHIDELEKSFSDLSKLELIQKLLSVQLKKIKKRVEKEDLNVSTKDSGNRRSKSTKKKSKDKVEVFINLGKMDRMDKSGIVKYLCRQSGLPAKEFGNIDIFKRHCVFEINRKYSKKIPAMFRGAKHRGRKLIVKLEK